MKKEISKHLFFSIVFAVLTINGKSQDSEKFLDLYFRQNVAIVDALIRSIDKEHYVKELLLKDFKKTIAIPELFEFDNTIFSDNGYGYDKRAGDGLYTSTDIFLHNNQVPYKQTDTEISVTNNSIVDKAFLYKNELSSYLQTYSTSGSKFTIKFDCDSYICSCNSCSCRTCWTPILSPTGTLIGVVKHCLKIINCHWEIGWER